MLKALRNGDGVHEATPKDEGYVAISANAVKNVTIFPLPEESKLVQDKYAAFPVSKALFRLLLRSPKLYDTKVSKYVYVQLNATSGAGTKGFTSSYQTF